MKSAPLRSRICQNNSKFSTKPKIEKKPKNQKNKQKPKKQKQKDKTKTKKLDFNTYTILGQFTMEIIMLLLLFYYYYYKSVSSRIIITKRSFIRLKKVFFLGVLSPFVASFMEHLHSFSVNEPYCIFLTTYQTKNNKTREMRLLLPFPRRKYTKMVFIRNLHPYYSSFSLPLSRSEKENRW